MDEYIKKSAALDAADSIINRDTSGNNDVVRAMTAWKEYIKALPSATDTNVGGNLIDREVALDVLHGYFDGMLETDTVCPKDLYNEIEALPSAQPELLTDNEQRIFLAAMGRERMICEDTDKQFTREAYEKSLVEICDEIERKVKDALWTE